MLESIFEPFFTTRDHDGGTGLGLSIVDGIVAQHGGFIRVESSPGAGTTFRLLFPRVLLDDHRPAPDVEVGRVVHTRSPTEGLVVLLVEDEPSVLRLGQRTLSTSGYQVLSAPDGETALDVARRHDGPIDLVVTDVVMPGLDLQSFVRRLHVARPQVPVLYVSGYAEDAMTARGVVEAGVDLLSKPYAAEELLARVAAALAVDDPA